MFSCHNYVTKVLSLDKLLSSLNLLGIATIVREFVNNLNTFSPWLHSYLLHSMLPPHVFQSHNGHESSTTDLPHASLSSQLRLALPSLHNDDGVVKTIDFANDPFNLEIYLALFYNHIVPYCMLLLLSISTGRSSGIHISAHQYFLMF
jgi:hypothetical protein